MFQIIGSVDNTFQIGDGIDHFLLERIDLHLPMLALALLGNLDYIIEILIRVPISEINVAINAIVDWLNSDTVSTDLYYKMQLPITETTK